jgi:flagellum-specific peptidoglycan hydrolase FlgJ
MLESDEAKSKLSATHKNFFWIKCWWKKCPKWHCVRKYDSMEKSNDRYKIYGSAWESFKDHSKFLHRSNYDALHELEQTDYKWRAKGLKEAWYATDPNYATLLIWIIERYSLNEFDLPVESTSN